ncbi:MAG: hypothetical protein ACK517_02080, partial [bacterium]
MLEDFSINESQTPFGQREFSPKDSPALKSSTYGSYSLLRLRQNEEIPRPFLLLKTDSLCDLVKMLEVRPPSWLDT